MKQKKYICVEKYVKTSDEIESLCHMSIELGAIIVGKKKAKKCSLKDEAEIVRMNIKLLIEARMYIQSKDDLQRSRRTEQHLNNLLKSIYNNLDNKFIGEKE